MKFTEKYDVFSATIDINDFCNMGCVYCWEHQGKNFLDEETSDKICDKLIENWRRHKKSDCMRVHFFGGEPLISWKIMERMMDKMEKNVPSWFGITTNATLIDDKIVKSLKKHNAHVMISIDGKKERHDANRPLLMGGPTYDLVAEAIKKVQAAGIDYEARMTVLPENAKFLIEDVTHLVEDLGIRQIAPVPVYDREWTDDQLNDFGNAMRGLYDLFIKYHFDYRNKVYIKFFEDYLFKDLDINHKLVPCGFGTMLSISIDTKGNIYPCHQLPTREYRDKFLVGNIITDEIIESDMVKALIPNSFTSDLCPTCPAKNRICSGGCPMESYEESGDLLSPTCSNCKFNRLYYEVMKEIQTTRAIPKPVSPGERRDFLYSVIMRMVGNIKGILDENRGKECDLETIKILTEAVWMINEQMINSKSINLNTPDLDEEVRAIFKEIKTEVVGNA